MWNELLRQSTCNQCLHGRAASNYKRSYCALSKREGNADRACWCKKFERRLTGSSDVVSVTGFKYRSKQVEDYRTRNQWADSGYQVKQGAVGQEMHASMMSSKTYIYYLPEDVEPMDQREKCCANCTIRQARYCVVAGGYISMTHHCSEWDG